VEVDEQRPWVRIENGPGRAWAHKDMVPREGMKASYGSHGELILAAKQHLHGALERRKAELKEY
jgi:hypothetical protein